MFTAGRWRLLAVCRSDLFIEQEKLEQARFRRVLLEHGKVHVDEAVQAIHRLHALRRGAGERGETLYVLPVQSDLVAAANHIRSLAQAILKPQAGTPCPRKGAWCLHSRKKEAGTGRMAVPVAVATARRVPALRGRHSEGNRGDVNTWD